LVLPVYIVGKNYSKEVLSYKLKVIS